MSRAIKFKNNDYIDSSSIVHKDKDGVRKYLKDTLFHVSGGGQPNNCNDMLENGIYMWTTNTNNKPSPNYGTIFTTVSYDNAGNNTTNWVNQLGFGTDNSIYFRQKINSDAWTNWRKIA